MIMVTQLFAVPEEPHITSSQCSHLAVSGDSSCSDHQCSWIHAGIMGGAAAGDVIMYFTDVI